MYSLDSVLFLLDRKLLSRRMGMSSFLTSWIICWLSVVWVLSLPRGLAWAHTGLLVLLCHTLWLYSYLISNRILVCNYFIKLIYQNIGSNVGWLVLSAWKHLEQPGRWTCQYASRGVFWLGSLVWRTQLQWVVPFPGRIFDCISGERSWAAVGICFLTVVHVTSSLKILPPWFLWKDGLYSYTVTLNKPFLPKVAIITATKM